VQHHRHDASCASQANHSFEILLCEKEGPHGTRKEEKDGWKQQQRRWYAQIAGKLQIIVVSMIDELAQESRLYGREGDRKRSEPGS
jgi:hypothetical protein